MPVVRIYIHCVWSTKYRRPCLNRDVLQRVIAHIRQNAKANKIHIDCINGYSDHIHCLLYIDPEKPVSQIIQMIKGESSHWINQQNLIQGRFSWGIGYYACSISPSDKRKICDYIRNQEIHHRSSGLKPGAAPIETDPV